MDKFEEFKEFCKDKEYLKQTVRDGKHTWQELYEIYDIYGPDAEEFKEKEEEKVEDTEKNDKEDGEYLHRSSGTDR